MATASTNPIRTAREKRGLSQEQLGRMVGVGKAAVSKWETGRGLPRPAQAVNLANVLKIRLDALYGQRAA